MQNARPKTRSRIVCVRFTLEEHAHIEEAAQAAEIEFSSFVRLVLLNVEVPPRARRRSLDREALGKVLVALNRIGGNINQLSREAHILGDLSAYRNAKEDRAKLGEVVRAIMVELE